MPHATGDGAMGGFEEGDAIQAYLHGQGPEGGADAFLTREIDQRDKAENAIDYEDISDDDDLPDEEGATTHLADDEVDGFLSQTASSSFVDLREAPQANGYHDIGEPYSDDLFGGEEGNDLFGEQPSSPELERQPQIHTQAQPQRPPTGLALPSKSGLALPSYAGNYQQARPVQQPLPRQSQYSPVSLSPPSFHDDGYSQASPASMADSEDEDDGETDEVVLAQRRLFRMAKQKQAGRDVEEESEEVDMNVFYTFFPGYEASKNPKFIELFPPRAVQYRGKVPLKPPRPVQPTKLSLDLLPDQERSFKSAAAVKPGQDAGYDGTIVNLSHSIASDDESTSDAGLSFADSEEVGGKTLEDFALICEDWGLLSDDQRDLLEDEWDTGEQGRPAKRRKINLLDEDLTISGGMSSRMFEEPESLAARLAKAPVLDFNDPHLLLDEHPPQNVRKTKRIPGDIRHDAALSNDLAKRYNISNDQAYDLLKENHQHKVRSTLGGLAIEHSLPATKLQYPYYRVSLDPKVKRSFHRPILELRQRMVREEFRVVKPKTIKKKERKGRDVKEIFATAESLALNDNSHMLLLEYSEEAPIMLSNFGMGNRLVNFYRKRSADDQERPKRDVGETHVLLTQDKSPFANFGHVDPGDIVPTIQNGLYRAPVFQHQTKPTDFFVAISTTHGYGSRMYLRNMENLHTVGQQFPVAEVPAQHSRRVTDAAKKRLKALAYRIYTKSLDPTRRDKQLDNTSMMEHLNGHDMPQTRSKMREFMKYEKVANRELGVWVPNPGQIVPDAETLRNWIKPEDVCMLDSMQVGVQRWADLGIKLGKEDEKDPDEDANIEVLLAPWYASKSFIGATQGKAMLKLHGEGDPTGRGEGFSFVKTSMKGGFSPPGMSVEDKIDAKKRRENGGHSYNVARQQKLYDDYIRKVWERQKESLASNVEISDTEMDDDIDVEPGSVYPTGRAATPRSSFAGTPAAFSRRDDETGTQFSRASDRGNEKVLIIKRMGGRDAYGAPVETTEQITNPRVIREYKRRRNERRLEHIDIMAYTFDGKDPELDQLVRRKADEELVRIERNASRREAREKQKANRAGPLGGGGAAGSPSASQAASPGPSDLDVPAASTDVTPQKGRGRNKDGTARKCANCGQVGHIKTNRKSVYTFVCHHCGTAVKIHPGGVVLPNGSGGGIRRGGGGASGKKGAPAGEGSGVLESYSEFRL